MVARAASLEAERWRMPAEGRVLLRRRALQKRERVSKMIPLRLQGMPHEEVRLRLGLSVGNYARAKRLLNTAVALSVASPIPLTVSEALEEAAELYVVWAIRLGELRHAGFGRRESQERLGCSDDEWEAADEWLRDVQAELSQGED